MSTSAPAEAPTGWRRIEDRQDYREFLRDDLAAHGLGRWRFYLAPKYPELAYQRLLRRVEYAQTRRGMLGRVLYAFHRLRLARRAVLTGISIPPGVFGPGLSVAHLGSIVVNDRARVGSWCRIHSGTNIGVHDGGVPTIGTHAYIAPGAVAFGGITIGDGVAIGANAVLTSDVPDGVTVGGIPARVISHGGSVGSLPEWFPRLEGRPDND
ncbi:serine O-acetyltransferase [Microbacterium sp. RURRCA19A]|uniref:serine O-acetyltransferase n=1 Tax=Microbacterium sp. RURRCA19A TaxID=1907391 RepID=UPI000955C66A|nr:hypothetical protein [Microbacterium sp. RURRCA19A]SIR78499.1 serine O-acetyltransferase [Microbacterium sp. RURRCA19A]